MVECVCGGPIVDETVEIANGTVHEFVHPDCFKSLIDELIEQGRTTTMTIAIGSISELRRLEVVSS